SFLEKYEKQGENVLWVEGDVSNKQEVQKMEQKIEDKYGQVDILINSVGAFVKKARFEDIEEEIWDKTVDINLRSEERRVGKECRYRRTRNVSLCKISDRE